MDDVNNVEFEEIVQWRMNALYLVAEKYGRHAVTQDQIDQFLEDDSDEILEAVSERWNSCAVTTNPAYDEASQPQQSLRAPRSIPLDLPISSPPQCTPPAKLISLQPPQPAPSLQLHTASPPAEDLDDEHDEGATVGAATPLRKHLKRRRNNYSEAPSHSNEVSSRSTIHGVAVIFELLSRIYPQLLDSFEEFIPLVDRFKVVVEQFATFLRMCMRTVADLQESEFIEAQAVSRATNKSDTMRNCGEPKPYTQKRKHSLTCRLCDDTLQEGEGVQINKNGYCCEKIRSFIEQNKDKLFSKGMKKSSYLILERLNGYIKSVRDTHHYLKHVSECNVCLSPEMADFLTTV